METREPESATPHSAAQQSLPLESSAVRSGQGWSVRLPVRMDQVSIDKQVVVYERVLVRRGRVEDRVNVRDSVKKETLKVTTQGEPSRSPASPGEAQRSAE